MVETSAVDSIPDELGELLDGKWETDFRASPRSISVPARDPPMSTSQAPSFGDSGSVGLTDLDGISIHFRRRRS